MQPMLVLVCVRSGTMLAAMKRKKKKEKCKVGPKTTAFLTVCRLTVMSRRHVLTFTLCPNMSKHLQELFCTYLSQCRLSIIY